MASQIISETIDDEYPVAGEDNDSQGFRDNFNVIKVALTQAKDELTIEQNTSARKNADNDYESTVQSNFIMKQTQLLQNGEGAGVSGDITISFATGHYHTMTIQGVTNINLNNWPVNQEYSEIYLHFASDNSVGHNINIASEGTIGASTISSDFGSATLAAPNATDTVKIVKAFTFNAGNTVYLQTIGTFTEV